ncbi:MAG: hypothetical protein HKP08_08965, partial [Flavobacteriaceae bacterium]|nr:hypothetical protein [Flavobacteriaceae bacterium]
MQLKSYCLLILLLLASLVRSHGFTSALEGSDEPVTAFEVFKSKAKQYNIATKTIRANANISSGYYMVAGVFGVSGNAHSFASSLKKKDFEADVYKDVENGMHYVYLNRYNSGDKAISFYLSDSYRKKMWILHVEKDRSSQVSLNQIVEAEKAPIKSGHSQFLQTTKGLSIASRTIENSNIPEGGYFAVAGVFGDQNNVSKFIGKMQAKGINAQSVLHPKTKLSYVYLTSHSNWEPVVEAAKSKLSGKYEEKMWIMHIPTTSTPGITETMEAVVNRNKLIKGITAEQNSKRKNSLFAKDPPAKLLQKADLYFDKMWYAEAAELYEQFLANNEDNYTYEVIQKAGDSHYFNSNMERAYYWYDILYNKYQNEISSENIFKYAHSLKGTGKYSRAKRLMRIYDRRVRKEGMRYTVNDPRTTPKEKVLDNILDTELEYTLRNVATNSEYSDFSPMFYNDDELVFASAMDSSFFSTRRYKWNNQPYLDLYVAKVNQESQEVKDAIKFSKKINTKYHEASVAFSPDNTT